MSDSVQNVKIRFTTDTEGLKQADKALEGLNKEERELIESLRKANKEQSKFTEETKKAGKETSNLNNIGKSVVGTIAGVFAVERVIAFTKNVITVTGQFQRLSAVLANSLGSESAAQRALNMLEGWAARTPFGLAEATSAYVKLVNQGFKPTEAEMTKLGDLAASTGKSFDQLTEAIIDGQTGEFERLKEFGIRASKEGDKVKFTFKGVQTQVGFTNEAIRGYILSLGELEGVSGSMASISATLEGRISNLDDSFDRMFKTIGSRTDTIIGAAITKLTELTDTITNVLTPFEEKYRKNISGFIEEFITENKKQLDVFVKDISKSGESVKESVAGRQKEQLSSLEALLAESKEKLEQYDKDVEESSSSISNKVIGFIKDPFGLQGEALDSSRNKFVSDVIAIEEKIKAINDLYRDYNKQLEKTVQVQETSQKDIDKIFQKRLEALKQEEELEKRKAKLRNANQGELIQIEEKYNTKRIKLTEEFHKQKEFIYKDFILKDQELEKEYTEFLKSEEKKRLQHQRDIDTIRFSERDAKQKESLDRSIEYAKAYSEAMVKADEEAAARRKEIQSEGYSTFVNVVQATGQIRQNQLQGELQELEEARARDLKGLEDNEQAKLFHQQRFDREERRIKREMAIADRNNALFTIAINTAMAVAKASPVIPLMVFAGAAGVAQAAVVSSKPIPKYNKGTKSVPGIDTGDDSVLAMIRPGEGILPVEKNRQYAPSFSAMFDGTVPANVMNRFVLDYQRIKGGIGSDGGSSNSVLISKLDQMNSSIKGLKTAEVNIDKNGIRTFVRSANSKTEFTNNYFKR